MQLRASRVLAFVLALACIGAGMPITHGIAAEADPLAQIKPGEWYEVPDSHLEAVAAPVSKFPWLAGSSGISGVICCWCGGALDAQRDRLYIGPGGGHNGYNGNEVYAFDLHDLKWRRLNDPDPVIPGTEYTDLNKAPFAMHTYDGLNYVPPPLDRYVVVGGWNTPRTYALNPDEPDHWEVYADHGTGRTGDISAVDPVSGLLWLSTPSTAGKLSQWDPLTKLWTLRARSSPDATYYETADIDSRRGLFVSCGHGKVKTWKLTPPPGAIEFRELPTTGGAEIVDSSSPGFCYVPLLDRFVAWSKGADVYSLDIDTGKWTKHSPAATNTVTPGPPDQWGTFGRFRYVPSKNVFVLCNSVKQNVFIYRLTADVPNVITAVEARAIKPSLDAHLPTATVTVLARYADGSSKDVTSVAHYFSLDPAVAQTEVRGGGIVTGIKSGPAQIRAVYSDPAFRRGYSSEVKIQVHEIREQSTLAALEPSHPRLTIVAGDEFQLEATGSYRRAADRFALRLTDEARWESDAPDVVSVSKGLVRAIRAGGPVTIRATLGGKAAAAAVTVAAEPDMRRISFQSKSEAVRGGWAADNGQPYSDERGLGWLDTRDLVQRDDRASAKHQMLMRFVAAKENQFRVKVPEGEYVVRVAMGDADYGADPFDAWTSLGSEKLVYYEGHHNSIATRIVRADDQGLVFTVKGPINYLIVAPVGTNLDKYADDGPGDAGK